jgi:hypothetical protein
VQGVVLLVLQFSDAQSNRKEIKSSLLNGQRDKLSVLVVIERGARVKKTEKTRKRGEKCFVQFNNLYMGAMVEGFFFRGG